ncbi:MAG: radical SAM protein [Candidatus Brocadiia bacterium]
MAEEIRVSEVFRSLQGETTYAGRPCAFLRTAGCNLHCSWCDTEYARSDRATAGTVDELCEQLHGMDTKLVCITGGEPLLQAGPVCDLAARLLDLGHTVLLETNGTQDITPVPDGAVVVMDVKCPASGESGKTLPGNLERLRPCDEVVFVIAEREDFDWAAEFVRRHGLADGPELLFSPAWTLLEPRELAEWILESGLEVRLQIQLHKMLWPEADRGV